MCLFLFFVKQKTAYVMRISDWSSDVCSSDLLFVDWGGEASMFLVGVDRLLRQVEKACEDHQEDHDHEARALALLQMRLGSPHQECGDVLGILVERLRRAVVIGQIGRAHV